jgi:predicted phosphodiesterase
MNKVAIIADTHWGIRGDNTLFMDMTKSFLDNVFFPSLQKHNIDTVVHLGDLVDKRKQISFLTAQRLRRDFLDKLAENNIRGEFMVGNHDCYYKNTNRVNALTELVEGVYPTINVYAEAKEIDLLGTKTLLLPWICDETRQDSMSLLTSTRAPLCMGHLEIQGFEMYKGSIATHGEDKQLFDKFDITLSGHYHHKSTSGGITYTGSHGEFTWSDYNDPRGFHILDLKTRALEFIENPYTMFSKLWYNDSGANLEKLLDLDSTQVTGKYIKLIVSNKDNPYWFDMVCGKLEKMDPIGIQIVEDHLNLNLEDADDIVNEAEGTLDIFRKHINQIHTANLNKDKLERVITDLYNQALVVES